MVRAWTVGNPNVYDKALSESVIHKAPGGWIWRTEEEALLFLDKCNSFWTFNGKKVPLVTYPLEINSNFEIIADEKDKNGVHILKEGYDAIIKPRRYK